MLAKVAEYLPEKAFIQTVQEIISVNFVDLKRDDVTHAAVISIDFNIYHYLHYFHTNEE